ncbi:hypothetical protein [Streptomyces rhizosphaerihabitans]|uniref:hypothetical protein n=1 Tax=Streptomyces rhizosphaerihabitans TaxID=1266770 RepID=UPI0028F71CD1|nr:hypothetical protein [Streptomyces rhizosphaerihabitans]
MRRRGWGAAVLVAAAVSGTLVVQGVTGGGSGDSGNEGKSGPIRTSAKTAALKVAASGTSAGLVRRGTAPFSMLGVTWAEPSARVTGTIEARARNAEHGTWSKWLRLDGNSGDGEQGASRGGTDPVWVGPSDGVEVRMSGRTSQRLPAGLRLDMIDPGGGKNSRMQPAGFVMDPTDPADPTDPTDPAVTDPPAETTSPDPSPSLPSEPPSLRASDGDDDLRRAHGVGDLGRERVSQRPHVGLLLPDPDRLVDGDRPAGPAVHRAPPVDRLTSGLERGRVHQP